MAPHRSWPTSRRTGYPDHPPLAPVIARLVSGAGLAGLRLVTVFAQVGCKVAAAVLAAEVGGRWRAQLISAAAVAGCPIYVDASLLFSAKLPARRPHHIHCVSLHSGEEPAATLSHPALPPPD